MENNNMTEYYSTSSDQLEAVIVQLLQTIGATLAAIGVLLNAAVCYTLIRMPNFIAPNPRIITISQTVSDGLSCMITLVYTYTSQYGYSLGTHDVLNNFLCMFWFSTWIMWAEFGSSIWNNAILTVERYVAICYVFSKWFTRTRVIVLCVMCQVAMIIIYLQIPLLQQRLTTTGECIVVEDTSYLRAWGPISFIAFYISPISITILLYSHMALRIYLQSRALRNAHKEGSKIPKSSIRLAKIAVAITVLHTVATTPDNLLFCIFYCVLGNKTLYSTSWSYSFVLLQYQLIGVGNSVIIFFGYPNFLPTFRQALFG